MSLERRLDQLEQRIGIVEGRCTHMISYTVDDEPAPESRCGCGGWHPYIVVVRPKGGRDEDETSERG